MTYRLPGDWRAHASRLGVATVSVETVTLRGPAACIVARLVTRGLDAVRATDGAAPSADALAVAAVVEQAAEHHLAAVRAARASAPPGGHADVPDHGAEASSAVSIPVMIGTADAAHLLGLSPRQARRYAGEVGVRRGHRRRLVWPRAGVVAVAARLAEHRDHQTPEHD